MVKLEKYIQKICEILELIVAVFVVIGILLSVFSFLKDFQIFRDVMNSTSAFKYYLDNIFVIVIGIEFLKMLCRPTSDNVMEILIFLVARHVTVDTTTTYENFVAVISVAILCIVRRYLHVMEKKDSSSDMED
ncbi:MAG: hypothetical protein HDT41_03030 [Lachnospiraceae bacterium]|nr:hypothetical protein [Lachnospiraceae bacterium]